MNITLSFIQIQKAYHKNITKSIEISEKKTILKMPSKLLDTCTMFVSVMRGARKLMHENVH